MRGGEQEAVGRQRERAARPGRHLPAARPAHHTEVRDRGREALGDLDDHT